MDRFKIWRLRRARKPYTKIYLLGKDHRLRDYIREIKPNNTIEINKQFYGYNKKLTMPDEDNNPLIFYEEGEPSPFKPKKAEQDIMQTDTFSLLLQDAEEIGAMGRSLFKKNIFDYMWIIYIIGGTIAFLMFGLPAIKQFMGG